MNKKYFPVILIVFLILSGISVYAISEIDRKQKEDINRQLSIFSNALDIVQRDYIDNIESRKLIYGSLKGMLSVLDPHSQFLTPEDYEELKIDTTGEFGGLGVEITLKDGLLTIITPLLDTPAWKAGIKPGDRIVKIDQEVTRDITLQDAVKKLRGKPGTEVKITIWREQNDKLFDLTLKRALVAIRDIRFSQILERGVGYIKIIEFRDKTANNLINALKELDKKGMKSLILDLRNNPGGLLEAAIGVSECFLEPNKLVIFTKDRLGKIQEYKSKFKNPWDEIPIVVLMNEGSASASEIVAASFKDYKRALIAGTKSFGKGSVQSVIPLSDGSALRLTTAKYYSPLGSVIDNQGVIPDVVIEETEPKEDLKNDIKNNNENIFDKIDAKESIVEETKEFDYKKDEVVLRALDLLKGIEIYCDKNKK